MEDILPQHPSRLGGNRFGTENANVCHEDRVSEMYAARRFERYADCTYV